MCGLWQLLPPRRSPTGYFTPATPGAAALVFSVASLPLLPHLPGCARGCARSCARSGARARHGAAAHYALARGAARRRESATGLVGSKGLPPADLEAWTEAVPVSRAPGSEQSSDVLAPVDAVLAMGGCGRGQGVKL